MKEELSVVGKGRPGGCHIKGDRQGGLWRRFFAGMLYGKILEAQFPMQRF
jgi:hypothetical protein